MATLRRERLTRDSHHRVILLTFDEGEALSRVGRDAEEKAHDDNEPTPFALRVPL